MTYKILDEYLNINCEIKEYIENINNHMETFDRTNNYITQNTVNITENFTYIKLDKFEKYIKGKIIKTDIYQILNNVIAMIVNKNNYILIHSCVISKGDRGILLLGDFGAGKTTLAIESEKYGFVINSADQSILRINEQNNLELVLGSKYMKYDTSFRILDKGLTRERIIINDVFFLVGICDYGESSIKEIKDFYHILKRLTPFVNWHFSFKIYTDNSKLFECDDYCRNVLIKLINLPLNFNLVRGDVGVICKKLEEGDYNG